MPAPLIRPREPATWELVLKRNPVERLKQDRIDPIAVAVSTGGASPALAQRLRSEIAAVVGPEHARLARELRELRPWAREHLATHQERKSYFEQLVAEALS